MYSQSILALLHALAIVGSSTSPPVKKASFIDMFDDVLTLPAGVGVLLQPVGVYQERLNYSGFLVFNQVGSSLTPPPSAPNVMGSGPLATVLYGPRAIIAQGNVTSFDLKSIYYACNLNAESTSAVLTGCTLQFSGVKMGTGVTVIQELVFPQPVLPVLPGNYLKAELSSDFVGLVRVDIDIVAAATPIETTDLLLDNVEYTAYF